MSQEKSEVPFPSHPDISELKVLIPVSPEVIDDPGYVSLVFREATRAIMREIRKEKAYPRGRVSEHSQLELTPTIERLPDSTYLFDDNGEQKKQHVAVFRMYATVTA